MMAYALIFTIGISSGSKTLLGLYTTQEKAEKVRDKHIKKYANAMHHYSIAKVELDKEVNITFAEW